MSSPPSNLTGSPRSSSSSHFNQARYYEAIDNVLTGRPHSYGGIVKDPSMQQKQFQCQTVPDVSSNTRIIGVCGIVDDDIDSSTQEGNASPSRHGWFFSDFFLFQQLFRGVGAHQIWLSATGTSPKDLLDKHATKYSPGYLFGAAEGPEPRKVVLSKTMSLDQFPVTTVPAPRLLENFLKLVETESTTAVKNNSNLLIFIFGHGNESDMGVILGPCIARAVLTRLTIEKLNAALHPKARVTLVMTSCYSGGWAISTDLNATVMAAAGPSRTSFSWGASDSLNRASGSVFATAVQRVLCDGPPDTRLADENVPPAVIDQLDELRYATYSDFAQQVYSSLFIADVFAYRHQIHFSAQDDDWEAHYSRRTGIPLTTFKSRFDSLENYANPPMDPDQGWIHATSARYRPSLDPEPATTPMRVLIRSLRSKTGGSNSALKSLVVQLAKDYLDGYTGYSNAAPNLGTHNLIKDLINGKMDNSMEAYQKVAAIVEYRVSLRSTANELLKVAKVPKPLGLRCAEYDEDKFTAWASKAGLKENMYEEIIAMLRAAKLLPEPLPEQGLDWGIHIYRYIAAALLASRMDRQEVKVAIQQMQDRKNTTVQGQATKAGRDRTVRQTAGKFFSSIGKSIRNLSPTKHWSTGSAEKGLAEGMAHLTIGGSGPSS